MNKSAKISHDPDGHVIENTAQRLTDEVAQALAARRSAYLKRLSIAHENDRTPEMRREHSQLRLQTARTILRMQERDADFERLQAEWRAGALKRSDQVSEILKKRRRAWGVEELGGGFGEIVFPPAPPVDHSFWWARTDYHLAPDSSAAFESTGLYFHGGPKVNDYDGEMHTSFGAVAKFALQPDRFPTSPSGLFLSSPHVELFGGVDVYSPDHDWIQGNGIASCDLFLRQTVFQWVLGGASIKAEAKRTASDLFHTYSRNAGYVVHGDMPGFTLIPAVTYSQGQIAPNELWAEIEARFDIYLNCTGACVWCNPYVLFRTFQWAPTPLP
jgi:hypothetical protein